LFEKTNEDPVTIATTSVPLTQATAHNVTTFNEKLLEIESKNLKLKDEIISLRQEMTKSRKVDGSINLLKENILEQQEQLPTVNVECFMEIKKMVHKVKQLWKTRDIILERIGN
jgi:hypothetical protein